MEETHDDSRTSGGRGSVPPAPQLVVVLECDRPLSGGARFTLDGSISSPSAGAPSEALNGRRNGACEHELNVRVPGRSVSAAHARLVRVGSSWAVEDLGSTNGTFVNGERVKWALLGDDDVFEAGHVLMRVNPTLAMPAGAPLDVDLRAETGPGHVTLDPSFAADLERAAQLAASGVPIVLIGESGTGKEVLARSLHQRNGRSAGFVAVNCGAIPSTLVESQLFGHVKGAFSGALRDELGFVRAAHGGTLFLDEIADLPKQSQAALLRVLQEGEVTPVGATQPLKVNLRVIAATHQPLEELVERGEFRRDLFARIAGFVIALPHSARAPGRPRGSGRCAPEEDRARALDDDDLRAGGRAGTRVLFVAAQRPRARTVHRHGGGPRCGRAGHDGPPSSRRRRGRQRGQGLTPERRDPTGLRRKAAHGSARAALATSREPRSRCARDGEGADASASMVPAVWD